MTARQKVVVACPLPTVGLDLLRRRYFVEAATGRPARTWLHDRVKGAAALVSDPSVRAMAHLCVENVVAVIEGREPPTPVV